MEDVAGIRVSSGAALNVCVDAVPSLDWSPPKPTQGDGSGREAAQPSDR